MFRNERIEMKVGLFIGAGIFLMFLIVFSISDFYVLKKGYNIFTTFDFVNGITKDAPVRLAGVHVGEIKDIKIYYDEGVGKTRVRLNVWILGDTSIEKDAVARINTLGLLGEQYLEITPGVERQFVEHNGTITGVTPVNVGQQMEKMSEAIDSTMDIMRKISSGEGTLGKLLTDDVLYSDLVVIFDRLKNGEGTIGKFLVDETVYDNVEEFTGDIKAHPWKLLHKTSDRKKNSDDE